MEILNEIDKPERVKYLIEKGYDPTFRDESGNNAISKACYFGYFETVQVLIDFTDDQSFFDKTTSNAVVGGNLEIIKLVCVKASYRENIWACKQAIYHKQIKVIEFLSSRYIDPEIFRTAFCEISTPEILDIVIKNYDPNMIFECGYTPIQLAIFENAENSFFNIIRYSNIETPNKYGRTAIYFLRDITHNSIKKYILNNANLNIVDYSFISPRIHFSLFSKDLETMLIKHMQI